MGFAIADAFMGNSGDYAGMAQGQEQKRQQAIKTGTQNINNAFSGFNPQFYQGRAQAYQDFAMPQLAQQYKTNKDQIGFGLANRGLQNSSAAQGQWTNLGKSMGQAKQAIVDTGIGQAQQLQQGVEAQRNTLLNQLYQSADPAGAGQSAIQTAANFQQPSVFQPLGNMLGNVANQYYLSQLINSYRPTSFINQPPNYSASSQALPGNPSSSY